MALEWYSVGRNEPLPRPATLFSPPSQVHANPRSPTPYLLLHPHQVPHRALLGVVGLGGVARRGADATVLDLQAQAGGQQGYGCLAQQSYGAAPLST